MKKLTDQIRVFMGQAGEVAEDAKGLFFFDQKTATFTDLTGVRLLRCAVDTVRQLYRGMVRPEVLAIFEGKPGMVDFACYRFHASRVGRDSGYMYKLQNSDLGLILLIKNFNVKPDSIGSHLKIEVSPHALDDRSPERLQDQLDFLASNVLQHVEQNQCAVHIALDFQGWTPPADFVARLHCKAQAERRRDGVNSFGWAESSAIYGRGQSFLFGSAGGVQLALYNKSLQAKSIDKLDYMESVWRRKDNPGDADDSFNYDPEAPVWRLELRYHHSVVQQFSEGSCSVRSGDFINTTSFAELIPHLDGLWRYGLQNFKLLSRPGVYDPFWTLVRDDVRVESELDSLLDQTQYKRHYKTARGFSGKSIDIVMGGLVSLLARSRVDAKKGFKAIRQLPVWPTIKEHYAARGMTNGDVLKLITERLEERVVRFGMAV